MTAIVEYRKSDKSIVSVQFTADLVPSYFARSNDDEIQVASIHASRNSSKMGIVQIQQLINDLTNNTINVGITGDGLNRPVITEFNPGAGDGGNISPYARVIPAASYNEGRLIVDGAEIHKGIRPAAVRAATASMFANI